MHLRVVLGQGQGPPAQFGVLGVAAGYGLNKRIEPVRHCRGLGKKDMKLKDATPAITVDPETYRVTADGEHLTCAPAETLPLAQRYFLF